MALTDFWNSRGNRARQDAAMSFLSTGSNAYNRLTIVGANTQGCLDSSDCASGWSCSGGKCRQKDTGAGLKSYGDATGCGDSNNNQPGGGGGGACGAGVDMGIFVAEPDFIDAWQDASDNLDVGDDYILRELLVQTPGSSRGRGLWGVSQGGKCLKTGCGGYRKKPGNGPDTCCGKGRCCRFSAGGFVQCFCGDCPPPPPNCSEWCTNYAAANGEPGEGCNPENTCSECEECAPIVGEGYSCKPKTAGPCYCESSSCSGECDSCQEDGTCDRDCNNCKTCYTTSVDCPCGSIGVKCCYSACDQTSGFTECRESVNCDEECGGGGGGGDPCAGNCSTVTTCTPDEPPPCPPQSSCRTSGTISAGGQTCTLTEVCDKSSVPESCRECDCNCVDDCPDCKICDASGKCVDDPECETEVITYHASTALGGCRKGADSCGSGIATSKNVYYGYYNLPGGEPGTMAWRTQGGGWETGQGLEGTLEIGQTVQAVATFIASSNVTAWSTPSSTAPLLGEGDDCDFCGAVLGSTATLSFRRWAVPRGACDGLNLSECFYQVGPGKLDPLS